MPESLRLSGILKPIVERYLDLYTEETKFNARMAVRKFVKAYAYITQLVRLHDEELFKEYVFASNLLKLLPKAKHPFEDVESKIKPRPLFWILPIRKRRSAIVFSPSTKRRFWKAERI